MKLHVLFMLIYQILLGCNRNAEKMSAFLQSARAPATESRVLSKGVVRLNTTYTLNSNQFSSTCSAALIHTPSPTLNYCVALTAAHCFRNIPKIAQHSIEVIDVRGFVSKSYRVADVTFHPDFTAADANQTMDQAAVDVALVEFKCALPNGIQPSRVLDISQLPTDGKLIVASYANWKSDEKSEENFLDFGKLLGRKREPEPAAQMLLNTLGVSSIDFPPPARPTPESQIPGALTLEKTSERPPCEGESGAPAYFDSGRELYLVGTSSSGIGFCDKENLRFAITSSLAKWINKTMESEIVTPSELPKTPDTDDRLSVIERRASSVVRDQSSSNLQNNVQNVKISLPTPNAPATVPTAAVPPAILSTPSAVPTQAPRLRRIQTSIPATKTMKDESTPEKKPPRLVTKQKIPKEPPDPAPDAVPTVPPIPMPPQEAADDTCMGVRLVAQSKSRVWGSVLTLLDKDSTQISDDSLKCEFPNEREICVVSHPVTTATGLSRVVLSQGIVLAGCSKFYSGRTIFLNAADFQVLP